jgi:hypothetical protein
MRDQLSRREQPRQIRRWHNNAGWCSPRGRGRVHHFRLGGRLTHLRSELCRQRTLVQRGWAVHHPHRGQRPARRVPGGQLHRDDNPLEFSRPGALQLRPGPPRRRHACPAQAEEAAWPLTTHDGRHLPPHANPPICAEAESYGLIQVAVNEAQRRVSPLALTPAGWPVYSRRSRTTQLFFRVWSFRASCAKKANPEKQTLEEWVVFCYKQATPLGLRNEL